MQLAHEKQQDVRTILQASAAGELKVPFPTKRPLEKWNDLQAQLAELEPLGENLEAVINAVLPESPDPAEDDLTLLRHTALNSIGEARSLAELPDIIPYRISQPDVPLETSSARVMSFHRSKGLTAELVVLAGLVDGVMPRMKAADPVEEQRAQLEEQRRVFFVGDD